MLNLNFKKMKQLKLFLTLPLLAGLVFFTSCEDDENSATEPSLSVSVEPGETVEPGDTVTFMWDVRKGDAKLESFEILRDGSLSEDIEDNNWDASTDTTGDINREESYIDQASFAVPSNEGTYVYTFRVTDKDGVKVEATIDIVASSPTALTSNTSITLGGQDANEGSFCIANDGSVYTISELANQDKYSEIDLIYYYGSDNKNALFSPKAIVDHSITWDGQIITSEWGTSPNETKFESTTTTWTDISTVADISSEATSASLDIASNLSQDDVYVFETAAGKVGAVNVTTINDTDGSGTITVDVKIEP